MVTVVGRLTSAPELRFTPSGKAVANFTVASGNKKKQGDQWVDGDKSFLRCSVWAEVAENVAETLNQGDAVVVIGKLYQREYDDREGNKKTIVEMHVDAVAAEITKFQSVKVNRMQRGSQAPSGGGGGGNEDPWGGKPADSGFSEEPPF